MQPVAPIIRNQAAAAGMAPSQIPNPVGGRLQNWYGWTWGDAQFLVLDPYWSTRNRKGRDGDGWTLVDTGMGDKPTLELWENADAILEGKNQSINEVVQQLAGDDEFVEVEDAAE